MILTQLNVVQEHYFRKICSVATINAFMKLQNLLNIMNNIILAIVSDQEEPATEDEEEEEIIDEDVVADPVVSITVPKILMTCELEDLEDSSHTGVVVEDIDSLKVTHLTVPATEAKLKVEQRNYGKMNS